MPEQSLWHFDLGILFRWTPTRELPSPEVRVAAGAAWLDEHFPGWHDRINLGTLDIRDGCRCIYGQLEGGWSNSERLLHPELMGSEAIARGFNPGTTQIHRCGWIVDYDDADALDMAWTAAIKARVARPVVACNVLEAAYV